MEPPQPAKIVVIVLGVATAGIWGLIIWIATVVSKSMLDTLSLIVDLAAMTP